MQFLGYLADIFVYCVITWLCAKLVIKELTLDYVFRREISTKYAFAFLPFLSCILGIWVINSLYILHQCAQVTQYVKSYYKYVAPYLSSKYELWSFSITVLVGYVFLKFVYHLKLRRVIAKRNEKILTEIENLAFVAEEESKTPNHIEYL